MTNLLPEMTDRYDAPSVSVRRSYLVCATPRTGSTALCFSLWRQGYGKPAEYFDPANHAALAERWGAKDAKAYVSALYRHRAANGYLGAKAHWAQVSYFGVANVPRFDRYIHLIRHDREAQARSWERADESADWRRSWRIGRAVDEGQLAHRLGLIERQNERWRRWFAGQRVEVLTLAQEELQDNLHDATIRCGEWIDDG